MPLGYCHNAPLRAERLSAAAAQKGEPRRFRRAPPTIVLAALRWRKAGIPHLLLEALD